MTVTPAGAPYRPAYIRAANGLYYRVGVSTTQDAPTAHGDLSGLDQDQHNQYLTAARVIAGTNITITRTSVPGQVTINSTATSGVTAHGALTGLANDDHPQYQTDARADLRYLRKDVADTAVDDVTIGTPGTSKNLILNGNAGGYNSIQFKVDGKLRWLIGRSTDPEEPTNSDTDGSNLVISSYNNDGVRTRSPVIINRTTGAVELFNDGSNAGQRAMSYNEMEAFTPRNRAGLILQGSYVPYSATLPGWEAPDIWQEGWMFTFQGLLKSTVNIGMTAGASYTLAKNPNPKFTPDANLMWPGAIYSFNGSTVGCTVGRLVWAPNNSVIFMPLTSGTLLANAGFISLSGSYYKWGAT
jgi:hypothetical protein